MCVHTIQNPRTLQKNIYQLNKRVPSPFFFQIPSYLWPIHSFDKTYVLLVTVELIWLLLLNILSFNFVPRRTNFRLARFRRSYVKRPAVVLTSCTSYTAFLLDVRCAVQNDHVSFFAAVCP